MTVCERFTGGVEPLLDVSSVLPPFIEWISAIRFEDWPQQHPPGQPLRPAMQTDLGWHCFGVQARPVLDGVMACFPGCVSSNQMVSVVMPGDEIRPHRDQQSDRWRCRVHVPLLGNELSKFFVDGMAYAMPVGHAYRVNITAEHAVENAGSTPRVHYMFDVACLA
jgi:hypothetical protein